MALAVDQYIRDNPSIDPETVFEEEERAMEALKWRLCFPNSTEALALGAPSEQTNVENSTSASVLITNQEGKSRFYRVRKSGWKQGQVALEFRMLRVPLQLAVTFIEFLKSSLSITGRVKNHFRR